MEGIPLLPEEGSLALDAALSEGKVRRMSDFAKYVALAKKLGMTDAKMISPGDIFFDARAILKCRWGCEDFLEHDIRCDTRGTSYRERVDMVKRYKDILIIHCHDPRGLSRTALEIERAAFLDGFYFAFAIRCCHLCEVCAVAQGKTCPSPERVRP